MIEMTGLLGLIVFVFDLWAIVSLAGSESSLAGKLGWMLIVLLLPLVGFLIWLLAGPVRAR